MKGFDPEFIDLDHYIRVITDRIWEGRRIDDIRRYYSDDCAVQTPGGVTLGVQAVIDGTRATLAAFPDRRLLAEDVIVSGDEVGGFLSSHRILSPMTHAGDGVFGPPTGKPVVVRTIADCVCTHNRIVHEWLVRDQSAIARQTGQQVRDLAQRWLNQRGDAPLPVMPAAPSPYRTVIDGQADAASWAAACNGLWRAAGPAALRASHAPAVIAALPGGEAAVGREALARFWADLREALPDARFTIEHLAANPRAGRATAMAMRWRLHGTHSGGTRYGTASARAVQVLGISHAEVEHGQIVREWVLMDDVAIWMQVLQPRQG